MTKRWEAKRAGFGRGTKDRSSSYRFYPIALAGLLDQIFLPVCTRAAPCLLRASMVFSVLLLFWLWKINAQSSSSTPFFPSFLSSFRSCSRFRVSYGENLISLQSSFSLVENISDENIPYWIRTSFLGRKVINFLLLLFTVAKCSERRENVDVRCWLIIGMIKTTQREIKDTRT